MESFCWNSNFETGLQDVDDQHRRLVDIINTFGSHLAENDIAEEHVESLLKELIDYAQFHFEDEEELMADSGLDSRHCEFHIVEHNTFLDDVLLFRNHRRKGDAEDARSILEYLIHWLAYHILVMDKNMARQMSLIAGGMTAADAWLAEEREADASTEPLLTALKGLFQQVSQRNRELAVLNQNLERIVEERTRELVKANANLEMLAMTDVLTELPNRRHALRQLQELWKEAQQQNGHLACMLVDADGFKAINDTYGHDAGDAVLWRLARELCHSVRSDDIVCRLGGDEFVIICPFTPLEGALHIAELTRANIAALQVQAGEGVWHGSISVGVAAKTADIASVDELVKAADEGVYMAKRAGRNCVRSSQAKVAGEVQNTP
ncbi:GGDEF domain-containing protein [Desulfopila aestuarii]|uniref:diguanylate cyclase n=1 Tax=Desulfopila aestuarii DSM 18488 TaxID=1121416 RepID=A0A1M7XWE7_9BACT|nr:GGDEF domain-containing protein [Desulfopila aestuarii]SHO43083.1 hemerythrin [Desulfopila aestuarii DSM 18488]